MTMISLDLQRLLCTVSVNNLGKPFNFNIAWNNLTLNKFKLFRLMERNFKEEHSKATITELSSVFALFFHIIYVHAIWKYWSHS